MIYKKLKIKKIANYAIEPDRPDRPDRPDKYSHRIEYKRGGVETVNHAKLPISSFNECVSQWETTISAGDASASENVDLSAVDISPTPTHHPHCPLSPLDPAWERLVEATLVHSGQLLTVNTLIATVQNN